MKRFLQVSGVIVLVAALGVGGFVAVDRLAEDPPAAAPADSPLVTASVVRTDLIERETLDGTLRFSDPGSVLAQAQGTITALPEAGAVLERGDVVYEVDGIPVVLMYGARPMWRPLSSRSDDGPDILQLEENLVALGYDTDGELTVDESFTSVTADLVTAWQQDVRVDDTGVVEMGRVLFRPGPIRVGQVQTEIGATIVPGVPLMATSSTDREVVVLLDADRQDLLTAGDDVLIDLPDNVEVGGTVRQVGRVVATVGSGPDASRVVEVLIDFDRAGAGGSLDEAPVDVNVTSEEALDVLAVPVNALLALAEGGYALEVADGSSTRLVKVEIGQFADGLVEVAGDIAEGDVVMVPR